MIDQIIVSALRDKHDPDPQRRELVWAKFVEVFHTRRLRKAPCLVANCAHNMCEHKNGSAWSPAIYPPEVPRQKRFVESISLLVVDLDHLTDEQLAKAIEPLEPYQRILHASHSDRPAGCTTCTCGSELGALHGQHCPARVDRCVRAIVPLSRPVTRDEWPRFWPTAMSQLRQPADPSCCDANRLYYLPSRPKDAGTYYFEAHDGIALDVEAILAIAPTTVPSIAESLQLDADGNISAGQRHASLKSIAGAMRFRGCGYAEIEAALLVTNRDRCDPPKSDGEVRAIARWAAQQPRSSLPEEQPRAKPDTDDEKVKVLRNHDADAALDFLAWAYPEGPWCLTAVEVDSYGIETATFFPDTAENLRAFLASYAQWNIYWCVNRPMRNLSKKADKTDIAAAHFLHVDINLRAPKELREGEDTLGERERVLRLFEQPPEPISKPTAVIFSGGGYQGLWRLAEPFVIDGDLAKAEELESYNRQLEWSFNTDACHNVDRILRLVGSVNYPNSYKRSKGRAIARAVLV